MSFSVCEIKGVLEDEELAEYAASEAAAFEELYDRYVQPVHRYIRAQVPDDATAEDLTAQVFFKAFVAASSYRGDGSYKSWIFQIARNTTSTWKSERARLEIPVERLPVEPQVEDVPVSATLVGEERDLVLATVAELPAAQQEVVRLRYYKDLTVEEIARITRRSTGAVRQLLHRARNRLRGRLSGKDLTALLGATGASALAVYSFRRHRRDK
ncbi:MAG: RNA polymerase sigma factor [Actinomycetota bacterium]